MTNAINRWALVFGMLTLLVLPGRAQEVTRLGSAESSLTDVWAEAVATSGRDDTWIVFSFDREMCEHCFTGMHFGDSTWRRSIEDVLLGREPRGESVQEAVRRTLDDLDAADTDERVERMVTKEVAVIIRRTSGRVTDIMTANIVSPFDFGETDILWLGKHQPSRVAALFDIDGIRSLPVGPRAGWVWALSGLGLPDTVLPLLADVYRGEEESDVRRATAFAIGNQQVDRAVQLLGEIIDHDPDREVRKAAIYGLGNNDRPVAREALLDIIRSMGSTSS